MIKKCSCEWKCECHKPKVEHKKYVHHRHNTELNNIDWQNMYITIFMIITTIWFGLVIYDNIKNCKSEQKSNISNTNSYNTNSYNTYQPDSLTIPATGIYH